MAYVSIYVDDDIKDKLKILCGKRSMGRFLEPTVGELLKEMTKDVEVIANKIDEKKDLKEVITNKVDERKDLKEVITNKVDERKDLSFSLLNKDIISLDEVISDNS